MTLRTAGAASEPPPDLASLTNEFKISLWDTTADLRGTFGYKDNVGLANTNRQGSAFWDTGGDLTSIRLPTHAWIYSFFVSADDRRYFLGDTSQSEQVILAAAQASRSFHDDWSAGGGVNYFFQNQILDLTAGLTNQAPITQITGHNFTGRGFVRKQFKPFWVELDLMGGRGLMSAPLDNFWQAGPRLSLGRKYGNGSDLTFNYQWSHEFFDTRTEVSTAGYAEPGTSLEFNSQTVDATWHQVWDKDKHWHTYLGTGYGLNQDNGGGYFDYSQYWICPKIQYQNAGWTFSASFRADYYDYPIQTIYPGSSELRRKTGLGAAVHAEKQLTRKIKLFADYAYDESISDEDTDNYNCNTVSLGLEWRL